MTDRELYEAKEAAVSAGETPLGLLLVTLIEEVERVTRERDEAQDRWARAHGARSRLNPLLDGADGVLDRVRAVLAVPAGANIIQAAREMVERLDGYSAMCAEQEALADALRAGSDEPGLAPPSSLQPTPRTDSSQPARTTPNATETPRSEAPCEPIASASEPPASTGERGAPISKRAKGLANASTATTVDDECAGERSPRAGEGPLPHDWDPEVKSTNLRCRRCGLDLASIQRMECDGPPPRSSGTTASEGDES